MPIIIGHFGALFIKYAHHSWKQLSCPDFESVFPTMLSWSSVSKNHLKTMLSQIFMKKHEKSNLFVLAFETGNT